MILGLFFMAQEFDGRQRKCFLCVCAASADVLKMFEGVSFLNVTPSM